MLMRWILASLILCSFAWAQSEREVAKRHYQVGIQLFGRGKYADALKELEAAKAALDRPEFDYNIGLCLAKLERNEEAATALERFVEARPDDPEAPAIRRRIAELRAIPPAPREAAPAPREVARATRETNPDERAANPDERAPNPDEPRPAPPSRRAPPPAAGEEPMPPGETAARDFEAEEASRPRRPYKSSFQRFAETPHGIATLALGGFTVAALLTATITGSLALSNNGSYRDSCTFVCDHGAYETAHSLAIGTDVMLSLGVAAGITTLVLALTRPQERPYARAGVVQW
jgi:tetratricopeptide (TPR) repeat protein